MKKIGAYEAKTHLSNLLEKVEQGQSFTITKRGQPVAKLTPVDVRPGRSVQTTIQRLKQFGKESRLGQMSLQELKDEGRP